MKNDQTISEEELYMKNVGTHQNEEVKMYGYFLY